MMAYFLPKWKFVNLAFSGALLMHSSESSMCIYDRRLLYFKGSKTDRSMTVPGYYYDETVEKLIERSKSGDKSFSLIGGHFESETTYEDHYPTYNESGLSGSLKGLLLIFGVFLVIVSARFFREVPSPLRTLVVGIFFAVVYRLTTALQGEGHQYLYIDSGHAAFAFAPVLILGEMLRLDVRVAKRLLLQFVFYGVVGGVLNTLFCTGILRLLLPDAWHFYLLLSVGALMSTSDASYICERLAEVGVPERIVMLIGGEGMSNDPALFAVLTLAKEFYTRTHLSTNDRFPAISPIEAASIISRIVFVGVSLGVVMGLLTLAVVNLASNRFEEKNRTYQILATLACGYATFLLAEGIFGMSGALAVVSAGWVLAWKMWPKVISEDSMRSFWEAIDFISETLLYLLVGFYVGFEAFEVDVGKCIGYSFLVWAVALTARFVTLFALWPVLNLLGPRPGWRELVLWSWCSLKSRIALALIIEFSVHLVQENHHSELKREVICVVGIVTLISNLINGPTAGVLAKVLKLDRAVDFEDKLKSILFKYSLLSVLESSEALSTFLPHTREFCLAVEGILEPGGNRPSSLNIDWKNVKKHELVSSLRSIYLSILKALYWEENEENGISIRAIQALLISADRAREVSETEPLNDFYHLMVILPSRDITAEHYRVIYALTTFIECHLTARHIFECELVHPVVTSLGPQDSMVAALQDAWESIKVESANSEQYAKNEISVRFNHETIDKFLTLRNLNLRKVREFLRKSHGRRILNERDSEDSNEAFVEDMEAIKCTMRAIGEGTDEHNGEEETTFLISDIQSG